jgi:hypothetical protein
MYRTLRVLASVHSYNLWFDFLIVAKADSDAAVK